MLRFVILDWDVAFEGTVYWVKLDNMGPAPNSYFFYNNVLKSKWSHWLYIFFQIKWSAPQQWHFLKRPLI